MSFAVVLTNFVSNTAAAAMSTPLAVSLARQLPIQTEPLALGVFFGCNLCYITPMAYRTNLLVMDADGYTFRDVVHVGLPLALSTIGTHLYRRVRRFDIQHAGGCHRINRLRLTVH